MASNSVCTFGDMSAYLPRASREVLDLVRKATAAKRHESRVSATKVAFKGEPLGQIVDLWGCGGPANVCGGATFRHPLAKSLGKGRWQASDGGAYQAAAEDAILDHARRQELEGEPPPTWNAKGLGDLVARHGYPAGALSLAIAVLAVATGGQLPDHDRGLALEALDGKTSLPDTVVLRLRGVAIARFEGSHVDPDGTWRETSRLWEDWCLLANQLAEAMTPKAEPVPAPEVPEHMRPDDTPEPVFAAMLQGES